MDNLKHPLLSICIPTYNHIEYLKNCLQYVIEASKAYEKEIEIIISDNCSTDGTKEYISQLNIPNLKYYRNEINLGFNKNLFLLVDDYATGDFVWTIGDDDYISKDSIKLFIDNHENTDLLLLRYYITSQRDTDCKKNRVLCMHKASYFQAIDQIADYGNILATFMTCAIFKKEKWNKLNKEKLQINNWLSFKEIFPNGYLLLQSFFDSKNVKYSEDMFIFIEPHEKDWDDKIRKIQFEILPSFFYFIKRTYKGNKNLKKTKELIADQLIGNINNYNIINIILKLFRLEISPKYLYLKLYKKMSRHCK